MHESLGEGPSDDRSGATTLIDNAGRSRSTDHRHHAPLLTGLRDLAAAPGDEPGSRTSATRGPQVRRRHRPDEAGPDDAVAIGDHRDRHRIDVILAVQCRLTPNTRRRRRRPAGNATPSPCATTSAHVMHVAEENTATSHGASTSAKSARSIWRVRQSSAESARRRRAGGAAPRRRRAATTNTATAISTCVTASAWQSERARPTAQVRVAWQQSLDVDPLSRLRRSAGGRAQSGR